MDMGIEEYQRHMSVLRKHNSLAEKSRTNVKRYKYDPFAAIFGTDLELDDMDEKHGVSGQPESVLKGVSRRLPKRQVNGYQENVVKAEEIKGELNTMSMQDFVQEQPKQIPVKDQEGKSSPATPEEYFKRREELVKSYFQQNMVKPEESDFLQVVNVKEEDKDPQAFPEMLPTN
jgi:hypothetical protein